MHLLHELRFAVRALLGRRRLDDEIDEELSFHLDAHAAALVAAGASEAEARREARRLFGGPARLRDEVRDAHGLARWDALSQHVRFAVRSLRRTPGVAAMVVITLALGIGANGAMFGIIDRLLLRGPADVAHPDELRRAYLTTRADGGGASTSDVEGYAFFALLRDDARAFAGVAGYTRPRRTRVGTGPSAPSILVANATAELFPLLGVRPALGRFYDAREDRPPRGADVVVVGYDYWRGSLGGDAGTLGRRIRIGDDLLTVIGVAPPGFTGPGREAVDAWIPMSTGRQSADDWATTWNAAWMHTIVRLEPSVSERVAAERATAAFRAGYTGGDRATRAASLSLLPLSYDDEGREPPELGVARLLYGVAVVVLLTAAANVANLLLARAARRRREVAVHVALGAGRARLAGMLLGESALLALLGGVLGVALAYVGGAVIRRTLLPDVAWPSAPVDLHVLAYTGAAVLATTLLIGLVPAVQGTRGDIVAALKSGGARSGERRGHTRTALQVAQVALSVVLLFGAGLFVISLVHVRGLDLGIQPDRVLVAAIAWPEPVGAAPSAQRAGFVREHARLGALAAEIAREPGVERTGIAVGTPFFSSMGIGLRVPGWETLPPSPGGGPYISAVAPGYFAAVGTRLVRGRVFSDADHDGSPHVAIVNQTMARLLWPGQDAIGKCLELQFYDGCTQVVGVVADARRWKLREDAAMQYYVPYGQERNIGGSLLVVRPRGDAESFEPALRHDLARLATGATTIDITTMQRLIDPQVRPWRVGALLFGLFGVLALVIAGVGLFSVASYLVAQRAHEMAVRVALGARAGQLARLVVGGSLRAALGGVALGAAAALALAPTVQPLLFETTARDPRLLVAIAAVLAVITVAAALVPWRRACRVDPITVLRAD